MKTTADIHYQEWGKSPPVLAQSVIDLARRLESPPLVMGMSLGACVAVTGICEPATT